MIDEDEILERYTDLTPIKLDILRKAAAGKKPYVTAVMRKSMASMINHDLNITLHGRMVLYRAERILAGKIPKPEGKSERIKSINPTVAAHRMQDIPFSEWLRPIHLKILKKLYLYPETAFGYLKSEYGGSVIEELRADSLITGESLIGSTFRLTVTGMYVLEQAIRVSNG